MKKNESLSETSKGSGVTGTGRDTKEDIPKFSKISSAVAEGDINMKLHNWEKAESAYTRALELNPLNKNALVSRSKCYMNMGRFDDAIRDADQSLSIDLKYYKGFLQKAEALYACGKFEFALVYYYKGFLLRKDIQDFRRGIRKAKIAINESIEQDALDAELTQNQGSIGNIAKYRMTGYNDNDDGVDEGTVLKDKNASEGSTNVLDRSRTQFSNIDASIARKSIDLVQPQKVEERIAEMLKLPEKEIRSTLPPHMTEDYPGKLGERPTMEVVEKKLASPANRRRLLGEFSEDEKYLQNLLKDKTFKRDIDGSSKDSKIYDLVSSTLSYLEKRKQFWKHSNSQPQHTERTSRTTHRSIVRPRTASIASTTNQTSNRSRPSSAKYGVRAKSATPQLERVSKTDDHDYRFRNKALKDSLKRSASHSILKTPNHQINNSFDVMTPVVNRTTHPEQFESKPSEIKPILEALLTDDPVIQQIYREQEELMESLKKLSSVSPFLQFLHNDKYEQKNNEPSLKGKLTTQDQGVNHPTMYIRNTESTNSMHNKVLPMTLSDNRGPLQSISGKVFDNIHQTKTEAEQKEYEMIQSHVDHAKKLIAQEKYDEAEEVTQETLTHLHNLRSCIPKEQQTKPKVIYAELYTLLATIFHKTGRDQQSIIYHKRAASFTQEHGYIDEHMTALANLAKLYESINMTEQAIEVWDTKRLMLGKLKNKTTTQYEELLSVYTTLGTYFETIAMFDQAINTLKMALEEIANMGTNRSSAFRTSIADYQISITFHIANIYFKRNEFEKAVEYFEKYLDFGRMHNRIQVQNQALTCLGNTYLAMSKLYEQSAKSEQAQTNRTKRILSQSIQRTKDDYISKALHYQRMAMRMKATPVNK